MKLTTQASFATFTKICAAGVSYGFVLLLAHIMSPRDFGQVVFLINTAALASIIGACGQQTAIIRFVPSLVSSKHNDDLNKFLANAFGQTLLVTCIVSLIAFPLYVVTQPTSLTTIALGVLLIPLIVWIDVQSSLLRARGKSQASIFPKEIVWRLFSGIILIAVINTQTAKFISVEQTLGVLALILLLLNIYLLRANTQMIPRWNGLSIRWRTHTNPFWISSVSNVFLAYADVIIVGLLIGPKAAGVYFAANRVSQLLAFGMTGFNVTISPKLSEAFDHGAVDDVTRIARSATLNGSLISIVIGAFIWVMVHPILQMFGPEFVQAETIVKILLLAGLLNAIGGPSDIVLNMCGQEKIAMKIGLITLIFSAMLLPILTLTSGTYGAAVAVLVCMGFRKFTYGYVLGKHMNMRVDLFALLLERQMKRSLKQA